MLSVQLANASRPPGALPADGVPRVVDGRAGDFDVPVAVLLPPIHAHTPLFKVIGLPPISRSERCFL